MLIDIYDVIVIAGVLFFGAYYFVFKSSPSKSTGLLLNGTAKSATSQTLSASRTREDRSFLGRMKSEDRQVLILFGSQTGTAEELAGRLAKDFARYGKKALVMDPEEIEVEDLPKITEIPKPLLILCVATYGEGDPTDNAQSLHEYFSNADSDSEFSGLSYAIFGLGNKTYEHYNAIGKFLDKKLEQLGAKRVFELGLADDDGNLEEDFLRWREQFFPTIAQEFHWELTNNGRLERQYRLEVISDPVAVFTGEFNRIGGYERPRPPFDQKNPYLARISVTRELHGKQSDRSCLHIEIKVDSTKIRYETGDHVAIFPTNDQELVKKLGKLLEVDLNTVIKLINVDEQSSKRNPFPCPCSYHTILTHYVDICAPVKSHVLKALVDYTSDEEAKERLTLLSTANEEGLKEYGLFIQKERRSIVDILEHFPSCKPPIDLLLELLPRLQARYYSISSSPKVENGIVSITAVVLQYSINDRLIKGVCTNHLAQLGIEDNVPIFIRKSTLRLPHRLHLPVIMVGPGTGIAPFRGFLQDRFWHKNQGKEVGKMVLFFGCRNSEHDFIYKNELEEYVDKGLVDLYTAFSRVHEQKVYVQHKIWENRDRVWQLIEKESAFIYVCGDARNMARDVQNTFLKIAQQNGGLNEEGAQKWLREMERQRRYQADVWS